MQSTVYGGNALKADVFRAKDVVDMLLDEDEEEDLKANQSRFLKTGRGRRKTQKTSDDVDMIDTSSAVKKKVSPIKPALSKGTENTKQGSHKKQEIFSTMKDGVKNIFATSKSSYQ